MRRATQAGDAAGYILMSASGHSRWHCHVRLLVRYRQYL